MGASFSAAVHPAVCWLWFREGYGSHSFAQPACHAAHGNYPLWYYRALVDTFRMAGSPLAGELDRVVSELEHLAATETNS